MVEYTNIITEEVITSPIFLHILFRLEFYELWSTFDVFTQYNLNILAFKKLRDLSKGYENAE